MFFLSTYAQHAQYRRNQIECKSDGSVELDPNASIAKVLEFCANYGEFDIHEKIDRREYYSHQFHIKRRKGAKEIEKYQHRHYCHRDVCRAEIGLQAHFIFSSIFIFKQQFVLLICVLYEVFFYFTILPTCCQQCGQNHNII